MIVKTDKVYEFMGCETLSFEKKDKDGNILADKDGKPEMQDYSRVRFADINTGAVLEFGGTKEVTEEIKKNGCIVGLSRHDEVKILIDIDDYKGNIGKARFSGYEVCKKKGGKS